jgi:hypothetical protein
MEPKALAMKAKNGRDLEEAAALIQEAILTFDPKLKGTHFIVERRKIVRARLGQVLAARLAAQAGNLTHGARGLQ